MTEGRTRKKASFSRVQASSNTIDIGDGLAIPRDLMVTSGGRQWLMTLTASYDPQTGRYRTQSLEVRALDDGEITGEVLRTVRVAEVLRNAIADAIAGPNGRDRVLVNIGGRTMRVPTNSWAAEMLTELAARGARRMFAGSTDEALRLVALLYRLAVLFGDAPTEAVALSLDVPRSTAARWVTRARDRGLLTVTDKRAGETV
jgi:hypothetical protein